MEDSKIEQDVTQQDADKGEELVRKIIQLSGLPQDQVQDEIHDLLNQIGTNHKEVTIDELRNAMLLYLETIQREMLISQAEPSELPQA